MPAYNLYETKHLEGTTGETLRPGGYELTEKIINRCAFKKGDEILDLGCGNGATLHYLKEKYGIDGMGLDPSPFFYSVVARKTLILNVLKEKVRPSPSQTIVSTGFYRNVVSL